MKAISSSLCPIYMGNDILESALTKLVPSNCDLAIVYDAAVSEWAHAIEALFEKKGHGVCSIPVPSGESSKCRAMKAQIEDVMLEYGIDRSATLIAIGGGVVTDLAGFVAATYMRGIKSILIPTTVLGMVDASIGGKTGINTLYGKNLIGAYHMPAGIVIDTSFLQSLPNEMLRSGFAEVIKYGCILNRELFEMLEKSDLYYERDPAFIENCIELSVQAKTAVVTHDPHEKGYRRILNFGHTIAHALELLSEYHLSHGDAVALGMLGEAYLSMLEKHLSEKEYNRIAQSIAQYEYPPFSLEEIPFQQFYEAMLRDKKSSHRAPRFVLIHSIGKTVSFEEEYCTTVSEENLRQTYNLLKERS